MHARNYNVPQFHIAILGGGFTGATLAAQLLRQSSGPLSVIVVDQSPSPGRGVAYGTQYGWHLLNVPAKNMSALPDDPDHFLHWAETNYDCAVEPGSYLPRRIYGQYVESVLRDVTAFNSNLEWKHDQASGISRSGELTAVHLRSGETVLAEKVVLAVGNFPPSDPLLPGKARKSSRYVPFAWSADALEGITQDTNILLVGSGLTAVDQVVALRARGFRGTIHLLSRRGLLPQRHLKTSTWPAFWNHDSPRTARGLFRLVRRQIHLAQTQGNDWRAVIDSLRPFTQQIWKLLPTVEKRRFLRHLRPYWEVHRHRVAPEIGSLLAYQLVNKNIQIHAGRVTDYHESDRAVEIIYHDRASGQEVRLRVDRVINCTGPETDCRKFDSPLLRNLREQGLIRPDELYLGLDATDDGALIHAQDESSDSLYTVGPTRKGQLWETTAVPEIRDQVAALSELLLNKIRSGHAESSDRAEETSTAISA
jgi:uncharacterized NAD(P)/FAD-binding protein YdhS